MILSKQDAKLFYKLNWSLLYYVNQKYPVIKGLKGPDLKDKDANKIIELQETFYSHLELIDSFVNENPFNFNQKELEIIKNWKKAIKDTFFVVSHTKKYTVFLQPGNIPKAYGVIGIYDKIEEFAPDVPEIVDTVLLPFKGKIVYSGIIQGTNQKIGETLKQKVMSDYLKTKQKFGIILSLDHTVMDTQQLDDDFPDLIINGTGMDWDMIQADMHEISTERLIDGMEALELFVNKKFALEIASRDDAVFWMRKLLQDGKNWIDFFTGDGWIPVHAIHILGLIKSDEALELLLDIIRYRNVDLSDWLIESGPGILYAFGEDAFDKIMDFSTDDTLPLFSRGICIKTLSALARKYPSHENEVKEYIIKLIENSNDDLFASMIIDDLASFHDQSVMPVIDKAYEDGKILDFFTSKEDIKSILRGDYDIEFNILFTDPIEHFSRENIEYLQFLSNSEIDDDSGESDEDEFEHEENMSRNTKKIGRNEPCPCGSGLKYKKCCMKNEI